MIYNAYGKHLEGGIECLAKLASKFCKECSCAEVFALDLPLDNASVCSFDESEPTFRFKGMQREKLSSPLLSFLQILLIP